MKKKEVKKPTPKDPTYAKKLEERAQAMFGKQYRFLPADQKRAVQANTKFEPKEKEAQPPVPSDQAAPENEPVLEVKSVSNTDYDEDDEEAQEQKEPEIITQFKCEDLHVTNGLPTAPARRCRVCMKPVKLTGRFVNDIFEPVAEK